MTETILVNEIELIEDQNYESIENKNENDSTIEIEFVEKVIPRKQKPLSKKEIWYMERKSKKAAIVAKRKGLISSFMFSGGFRF